MQSFSTTETFSVPYWAPPATLIVDANGGSVQVEVLLDTQTDTWIVHETYTADGAQKVEANGLTLRITPAGGAAYALVIPE